MGKYEPLTEFLKQQTGSEVRMSFAQIERVIGSKLPPVARHRAWWSNSPSNNVMTQAWLDAGSVARHQHRPPSAVRVHEGHGAHSGRCRSDSTS